MCNQKFIWLWAKIGCTLVHASSCGMKNYGNCNFSMAKIFLTEKIVSDNNSVALFAVWKNVFNFVTSRKFIWQIIGNEQFWWLKINLSRPKQCRLILSIFLYWDRTLVQHNFGSKIYKEGLIFFGKETVTEKSKFYSTFGLWHKKCF